MASHRDTSSARRKSRASSQGNQGPQGIKKEAPRQVRRSKRIQESSENRQRASSLPTTENLPSPPPLKSRKRPREVQDSANNTPTERPLKRLQSFHTRHSSGQTVGQDAVNAISPSQRTHISHWVERKTWPRAYFKQDNMHHLIARQKSTASLRRKRSDPSLAPSATPSDQRSREEKSAPYRNPNYPTLLEALGDNYMEESELGITDASKLLCQSLLETKCTTPQDTLFSDNAFQEACKNLRDKNEARIIQDIGRLLVPSPETLTALRAEDLRVLNESVNEGWNNSIPATSTRPQPDFSVGFRRFVFSDDQLSKLQPMLGDPSYLSYFRATYYMYFPVLTCEAKCGTAGLDIADRQNAHSMTLAVRGIVELFKLAKKEDALHRELLTFSVSHDHRSVRLYGYYPIIDGPKTKIYRHPIHAFDITALDGKERWTTYKFTVGVYNYSLNLLKRIHSIVDELSPDFSLKLTQPSEPKVSEPQLPEPSGLSQQLEGQNLAEVPDSQPKHVDQQQITPDPSTQAEKPASKKKKKGKGKV